MKRKKEPIPHISEDDFTQKELEVLYDGIITPGNPRKLPPGTLCKYCQNHIEYRWIRVCGNEQREVVHVYEPGGELVKQEYPFQDGKCAKSPLSRYYLIQSSYSVAKRISSRPATSGQERISNAELVLGRFRSGSELALMVTLLVDGVARSIDEINKVTKSKKPQNIAVGKYLSLRKWGEESGWYSMNKTKAGKICLTLTDVGKKAIDVFQKKENNK